MAAPRFDNAFLRDLPGDPEEGARLRQVEGAAWARVMPQPVAAPRCVAHSPEVAAMVGFDAADIAAPAFAQVFAGNALLPGMDPFATTYGGHQFGHWAGQLGDGRAISLGEAIGTDGRRLELQLKGAGTTPFSRGADGRAVMRSSVREFLCSEAMHHLGVPTTRALSLVATGEGVVRDMFYDGHPRTEAGAVVCRVAPSFLRLGHFELPAARGDHALLRRLVAFCIHRDFPELMDARGALPLDAAIAAGAFDEALLARWFRATCERTAVLVAHWMRVGFVHGVLNTDNLSILGLTIDYGPYGWMEDFDPDWTPNTTDAQGRRYRYAWQPRIAHWNLACLAQALSPLFASVQPLQDGIDGYVAAYDRADRARIVGKLGLGDWRDGDDALMADAEALLQRAGGDMTLFFRGLGDAMDAESEGGAAPAAADASADASVHAPAIPQAIARAFAPGALAPHAEALRAWLDRLDARVAGGPPPLARRAAMHAANPRDVPRNWRVQEVIDRVEQGDDGAVATFLDALRRPYDAAPPGAPPAQRRPDWAVDRAGCSMLSCSS